MKRKFASFVIFASIFASAGGFIQVAHAQATPRRIEVTAKRFEFTPGEITVKKGEPVVLVLKSVDVNHGIRIKELHVDAKVGKGQTTEVAFTADKTGTFVGHCSVFCGTGHGTMKLTIHVTE
jgi:cytochrome c oxidase subunit II